LIGSSFIPKSSFISFFVYQFYKIQGAVAKYNNLWLSHYSQIGNTMIASLKLGSFVVLSITMLKFRVVWAAEEATESPM
jgi:hypothetical protein